ncbi:hypothetical protein, partial [Pseudomonas fluorescens]
GGAQTFWLLLGRLPKVTRRKGGTLSSRDRSNGYVLPPNPNIRIDAYDDHRQTSSHKSQPLQPLWQRRSVTVTRSEMMHLTNYPFSKREGALSLPQQTETFHARGRSHLAEYSLPKRQRCLKPTRAWDSIARLWITDLSPEKTQFNAEPSPRRIVIYSEARGYIIPTSRRNTL